MEAHPYRLSPFSNYWDKDNEPSRNGFQFSQWYDWFDIQKLDFEAGLYKGSKKTYERGDHPYVINEYGWLWVTRDGKPTLLSEFPFAHIFRNEPNPTAENYREASAYLWAGLTGYWRAHRNFAGIQHFVYITGYAPSQICESKEEFLCHIPGAYLDGNDVNNLGKTRVFTSDPFMDIENQKIEPRWLAYGKMVWNPMAIYIDYWKENFDPGKKLEIPLIVTSDYHQPRKAQVFLYLGKPNSAEAELIYSKKVNISPNGKISLKVGVETPKKMEPFIIYAELKPDGGERSSFSIRKLGFKHLGQPIPFPSAISVRP